MHSIEHVGKEDNADALIEQLISDKLHLRSGNDGRNGLRWDDNSARRLLHVAVSDVNDDVRRTAVMARFRYVPSSRKFRNWLPYYQNHTIHMYATGLGSYLHVQANLRKKH